MLDEGTDFIQKKEQYEISIGVLMALCNIVDEYETFTKKLKNLISLKYNRDLIYKLGQISRGKRVFGERKVKKFYQENKRVIDIINEYSSINVFICDNYDTRGNFYEDAALPYFYQYILKNKDKIARILSLLKRLKDLGFMQLKFNENTDFSDKDYHWLTGINYNHEIYYLDNMELIPTYQKGVIQYRTTESNYCIRVWTSINNKLSDFQKTITVNNLLFDPKTLPNAITNECIVDKIIKLKDDKKETCDKIRDSVYLNVGIDDLNNQFIRANELITSLSDAKSKEELKQALTNINAQIEKMYAISSEYDETISQEDSNITKEMLEQQKLLYLTIRRIASIDLC